MEHDIAADSFIGNWPHWVRWICVIPAALLGSVLVSILWKLFLLLGPSGIADSLWVDLLQDAILGGLFVYFGAAMAPRGQLIVGLVLLVISVSLSAILAFSTLVIGAESSITLIIVNCIAIMVGSAVSLYAIFEEMK